MNAPLTLDPATVEAIARRTAELLRDEPTAAPELVNPAEAARQLGVSRDYLYENADRFGAVRLGNGPRARIRFNLEHVRAVLDAPEPEPHREPASKRRAPARGPVELLPIGRKGVRS